MLLLRQQEVSRSQCGLLGALVLKRVVLGQSVVLGWCAGSKAVNQVRQDRAGRNGIHLDVELFEQSEARCTQNTKHSMLGRCVDGNARRLVAGHGRRHHNRALHLELAEVKHSQLDGVQHALEVDVNVGIVGCLGVARGGIDFIDEKMIQLTKTGVGIDTVQCTKLVNGRLERIQK